MQIFTKFLILTLLWGLAAEAQTTSQKQWQNERPPAYRFPRIPRDGPVPFLSASRAERTDRMVSTTGDSNTTLIGRWIGGPCVAVAVAGTKAYFGNGRYLMIADISDPSKPAELGKILLPAGIGSVTVNGNFAYVSADGLRVIDVSNPASPNEVGFFANGGDVAVSGNYAYVAARNGLRIIDVSNPASPTEVSFFGTGSFNAVAVSGNFAYLADDSIGGLRIIDVTDPAHPSEAGFFKTFEPFTDIAFDVTVSGNFAYVADQSNGVRIIDVRDPANPKEVGFLILEVVAGA